MLGWGERGKLTPCENPRRIRGCATHLFDSDADSDGVDGSLDQDLLLVITTDDHRLQQQLFAAPVATTPSVQDTQKETGFVTFV